MIPAILFMIGGVVGYAVRALFVKCHSYRMLKRLDNWRKLDAKEQTKTLP